jgi:hypothetical protein
MRADLGIPGRVTQKNIKSTDVTISYSSPGRLPHLLGTVSISDIYWTLAAYPGILAVEGVWLAVKAGVW